MVGVLSLGANTPFAKLAYQHGMTAPTLLLVRYSCTILVLGTILRFRSIPIRQPAPVVRGALVPAVFLVLTSFGYLGAIQLIPLSLAVLLLYTMAAWTALFGHLLGIERLTSRTAGAALLAVTGVGLAVGADFSRIAPVGVVMALAGSVFYSLMTTVGRRASAGTDTMLVNFYAATVGAPLAVLVGLLMGNHVIPSTPLVWGSTLASACFYILGYSLVLAGIQRTTPSRAGVTMTLEPLVTVVISIFMLSEPFSPSLAIGGALVFIAILMVALQNRNPRPTERNKLHAA